MHHLPRLLALMPPKIELELNLETGSVHSVHSIGDPMDTDVKDDTDSDGDEYAGSDGSGSIYDLLQVNRSERHFCIHDNVSFVFLRTFL